jgi:hypothetical protein
MMAPFLLLLPLIGTEQDCTMLARKAIDNMDGFS